MFPSPLDEIKLYLQHHRLGRQAHHVLINAGPEERARIVAEALYRANRYAYSTSGSDISREIYQLKDRLVEHFYRAGYCVRATCHQQIKRCWYCKDGLQYDGSECHHCGGDGIYDRHDLVCFEFSIGGQSYSWHMPRWRVVFPVATVNDWDSAEEWHNTAEPLREALGNSLNLIRLYLNWYGMLKIHGWTWFVRQYLYAVREWLNMAYRDLRWRLAQPRDYDEDEVCEADDEIPF